MRRAEELLRDAQTLIERGWSQHAEARDRDQAEVEPWDSAACSWSLLGALVAVMDDYPQLEDLAEALGDLADVVDDDSLAAWNDDPARSQKEVAGVLAAAADTLSRRKP
jgi:hypothetical protein